MSDLPDASPDAATPAAPGTAAVSPVPVGWPGSGSTTAPDVLDLTAPPVAAAPLYDVDPDVVAALVQACPAVARMSAGPYGTTGTPLPGRRVTGVRVGDDELAVHVVLRLGATVPELAAQVRRALSGRLGDRELSVVVEDVDVPVPAA